MKKMLNKTVLGYYIASAVLGALLLVAISVMLELALEGWIYSYSDMAPWSRYDQLWCSLPMTICAALWYVAPRYLAGKFIGATATLLSIVLFVMIAGSKNWRTKVLQAIGWALLSILIAFTIRILYYGDVGSLIPWLIPAVLTVIPLTILKKTRMTTSDKTKANIPDATA